MSKLVLLRGDAVRCLEEGDFYKVAGVVEWVKVLPDGNCTYTVEYFNGGTRVTDGTDLQLIHKRAV